MHGELETSRGIEDHVGADQRNKGVGMIKGRKVYDPLTRTWSTGYWVTDEKGNYYPVWSERSSHDGE